ncbi:hypothetical protein EMGBS14_04070 [Candidatus Pelagibacterales bacterium]|nr:hypothetical protein EMGBS14_04070 [Pelagibacterales bacterium]
MTNSHKLGIENENECIRYGFYFQRNYSSDKDLKPATNVFFGITLLPFGENYTTSIYYLQSVEKLYFKNE